EGDMPRHGIGRQQLAGFFREIDENGAGFENRHRLAVGTIMIDQGGDFVIGADLEEIRLELGAGTNIHRMDLCLQAKLLQHDVDLVAVRRAPGIEVEHYIPCRNMEMIRLLSKPDSWATSGRAVLAISLVLARSTSHDPAELP